MVFSNPDFICGAGLQSPAGVDAARGTVVRSALTVYLIQSVGSGLLSKLVGVTICVGLALVCDRPALAIVVTDIQNDGVTTAQMTSALQGSGVTITNLVITTPAGCNVNQAIGLFSQGTTPTGPGPVLGDDSGVVLSTGALKGTNPLVSSNDAANVTTQLCTAAVSDADMRMLEPATNTGEYVAIEFDVVPTQAVMTVPFQFGSDEFPEYVCSAYNDVAGIFVSGPGIAGPYSLGAQNYAKTATGVLTSINWVNTGVVGINGTLAQCGSLANSAYYTDNSNGNTTGGNATVATTNTNLELDGWTNYIYQPITVTPGATYHVKIAVADAGDRQYDSALFLHRIFSAGSISGFDFGDAPDSYKTLTASGGPRHAINPNIYLGTTPPDSEVNGQPSADAMGDNNNGVNDEDGVAAFPALTTATVSYSLNVIANNTTGASANLVGWIDFNRNGVFDPGEGVSVVVPNGTVNGTVTLNWTGLSGLVAGITYARFRLTTDTSITTSTPGGTAFDGEVEDYMLVTLGSSPPGSGNKPLYLYDATSTPAQKLSRVITPATVNYVQINRGANQVWTENPVLQLPVAISNTVSPGGIPVLLNIAANNATRTFTASIYCSSAPGTILTSPVATSTGGTSITIYNLTIPFTGPIPSMTCSNPNSWVLRIDHTGAVSATNWIRVYPVNGTTISKVTLPSQNIININDSDVTFYSAAYPGGSVLASVNGGQTVYIRALVTDPFGSFDINGTTLTLRDSTGAVKVNSAAMTQVFDSVASSKIYEYAYAVPSAGPAGNWTAVALAKEGAEVLGAIDSGQATMPVVVTLPNIFILKTSDKSVTGASPGEVITYTIQVKNDGTGPANTVTLTDTLGNYNALAIAPATYTGPFKFTEGSPLPSGLTLGTPVYSSDGGGSYTYTPLVSGAGGAPAGYDGLVTNWKIPMNLTMNGNGGNFTLNYKVIVK